MNNRNTNIEARLRTTTWEHYKNTLATKAAIFKKLFSAY